MQKIKLKIITTIFWIIDFINNNFIKKYLLFILINKYLNFLIIIILGSNHPRRVDEFKKYLKWKNSEICWKNILSKKKIHQINVFIGDSHSEFYGRNFTKYKNNDHYLCYWTGPTTLVNFCTSTYLLNSILSFINFIYIINKKKCKKINIIFSFGEIDIRTFFFENIYINKLFKNQKILIKFIVNNFSISIRYINDKTKKLKIKNIKYYFKEIGPTSNALGLNSKDEYEIKNDIAKKKFPVLGRINERVTWRKQLMQSIKRNNIIKILKISPSSFNVKGAINNYKSIDNNHITDVDELIKTQKNII